MLVEDEVVQPLILADHSAFLQEFRNWESAWAMEALHSIAYELRTIAEMVIIAEIAEMSYGLRKKPFK